MNVVALYASGLSVEDAARRAGMPASTARRRIVGKGAMRPRTLADKDKCIAMYESGAECADIAESQHCCIQTVRRYLKEAGVFKPHRKAKGFRINNRGYVEHTSGEHAGRGAHAVIMERVIGRGVRTNEVVHHIDGDKQNNNVSNLVLMTRAAHTRLHRLQDELSKNHRERDAQGRFI